MLKYCCSSRWTHVRDLFIISSLTPTAARLHLYYLRPPKGLQEAKQEGEAKSVIEFSSCVCFSVTFRNTGVSRRPSMCDNSTHHGSNSIPEFSRNFQGGGTHLPYINLFVFVWFVGRRVAIGGKVYMLTEASADWG